LGLLLPSGRWTVCRELSVSVCLGWGVGGCWAPGRHPRIFLPRCGRSFLNLCIHLAYKALEIRLCNRIHSWVMAASRVAGGHHERDVSRKLFSCFL
jgi:hypothetical protein